MEHLLKYPRTRHLEGSRLQSGDEDLKSVRFGAIKNQHLVLEEKVDGANCGISFDEDGTMLLQSRGHYLCGGYGERQFDMFKTWAGCYTTRLYEVLGKRYIMYGEWLYAKHTVFYDALTHYFMEFDIYDRENGVFLSTQRRRELLSGCEFLVSVRVLFEGRLTSADELASYLGRSAFKSGNWQQELERQCGNLNLSYELAQRQTDSADLMEGIYIKAETGDVVVERLKYVRSSFLNTIMDSETHWLNRPVIPNRLRPDSDIFAVVDGRVLL